MSKKDYRVCNWKEYNQSLVNRGSITFWFDKKYLDNWSNIERSGKRGRPEKYNDCVIECGLTLKALFGLTFRSTEGFLKSLIQMMNLNLEVPNYSLLCKRQKNISISLKSKKKENIHVLIDSTGLKVLGEGEWKVRQHGYIKKRLWRKLHLAINRDTQELEALELTELGTQDWEGMIKLVQDIENTRCNLSSAIGDGAYDRFPCYELGERKNFSLITPPQRNASTTQERGNKIRKAKKPLLRVRDEAIKQIREIGRAEWKIKTGYHKRSLAETAMFRVKTLLGNRLSTRKLANQKVEAAIWGKIINQITGLGMPTTIAVS